MLTLKLLVCTLVPSLKKAVSFRGKILHNILIIHLFYVLQAEESLTFRYRASSIQDRHFAALQRTLFIYLINKYISLSDICLTAHH